MAIIHPMSAPLPTLIFVVAALAVVLGQLMILRSTARAWQAAGGPVPLIERAFAWLPALVLVLVLWLSWRATVAPPVMELKFTATASGVGL